MKQIPAKIWHSSRRIMIAVLVVLAVPLLLYVAWHPGRDITDGRHDRGSNAVWLAHGWLGADEWFVKNDKTNQFGRYRNPERIGELARNLKRHGIADVFPHLCPAEPNGHLPAVDAHQVEQFLDQFSGFRVLPWIGGVYGSHVQPGNSKWRAAFVQSIGELLAQHPRFAGIHLNIEPLTSGDADYLKLLEEIRAGLPKGKILSVAAYPPPTRWHPYPDVHWEESFFRQVAQRCDQLAVMMYDAGQKLPKTYQRLMADWAVEVLSWSEGKAVLLGVPTYDDAGVEYHNPSVENLTNALLGIHRGLADHSLPANYQGVAIYSEWETSEAEWAYFREHFVRRP